MKHPTKLGLSDTGKAKNGVYRAAVLRRVLGD